MQLSFRHSSYKATISQPSDDENLIHDFVVPDKPSNHPILKCVTSKIAIRPSLAADDSDFYNDEHDADEELTIFDEDDDEIIEFDEEYDEPMVFDEEDIASYENDEGPARSTILDEENTAPDPVLTVQDENPSNDGNNTTASTFFWHNPFFNEISRSYFQQCSYWNK